MTKEQLEKAEQMRIEMYQAALPLIIWMRENVNPHAVAHVDNEGITLYSADAFVPLEEGLKSNG